MSSLWLSEALKCWMNFCLEFEFCIALLLLGLFAERPYEQEPDQN